VLYKTNYPDNVNTSHTTSLKENQKTPLFEKCKKIQLKSKGRVKQKICFLKVTKDKILYKF